MLLNQHSFQQTLDDVMFKLAYFEREAFVHADGVHVLADWVTECLKFAAWVIGTVVIENRRVSN